MSISPGPRSVGELSSRERGRAIAGMIARSAFSIALVAGLYFWLPLRGSSFAGATLLRLTVGFAVFALAVRGQVRRIARSRLPEVDAVESILLGGAIFLYVYASCYFSLSAVHPSAFSQPLDRTGALYFTITTFGTVGYGDLSARSHLAQLLVSSQILLDIAFLAVMIRLLFGASRRALLARDDTA